MKKALLKFFWIYVLFVAVFMLLKPVFMLVYLRHDASVADALAVLRHGATMDLSVAGYLTLLPGLLIVAELITPARWPRVAMNVYMGLTAALVGIVYCLDMGLYGSWGFRLDMTPLFYITTSPAAAMASVQWWHWFAGAIGMGCICCGMWLLYRFSAAQVEVVPLEGKWRAGAPALMLLVTALLIIPIRGSVTVSTMNLSRAYFSENQKLNHAAINPLFSLLYSATHQGNFSSQYDFMPDDEAEAILGRLLTRQALPADSLALDSLALADGLPAGGAAGMLLTDRPDIVMVVLESFSAHLMPSLGGAPVALGLDSIAREGVLFTDFYASSFRTDRGLAAIFSGFPAPTTTSLLKYVDKFEKLPSLPGALRREGYDAAYYYGGDANFTNMQAYLVSMGFNPVVSDKDFPLQERASKWGAHDGPVFDRALRDISDAATGRRRGVPRLSVVQTSSSHEPFEVPYSNPAFEGNPRANAFAYADSCLTAFVDSLRNLPNWSKTLVVILPDHYGCWPENLATVPERHHIPLVLTGGALARRGLKISKLASQTDLAATLLAMMGLPHSQLRYSRDIFAPSTAPAAVFTEPSIVGILTPADTVVYNPDADAIIQASPPSASPLPAKAFLRDLYSTLSDL